MAYNSSGSWTPEEDGVASRIAAITAGNADYIKQARTTGFQAASRRGLGNSSMAAGASEAEAIRAAAPVASQEAQQTFQKNLTTQQGLIGSDQLARQIAAQERQQITASTTDLTAQSLGAFAKTLENDKIPGPTRAAVQQSINDRITAQQRYIEALYGFRPVTPQGQQTPVYDPSLNVSGLGAAGFG